MDFNTVFLSDIHIGIIYNDNLKEIINFLKNKKFNKLILVGDIFDNWILPYSKCWDTIYDEFIKTLNELSKKINVIYILGNHDENVHYLLKDTIQFKSEYILNTIENKKIYICHGQQFVSINRLRTWVLKLLYRLYGYLIRLEKKFSFNISKIIISKIISSYLKKDYTVFKNNAIQLIFKMDVDGIVCGHNHKLEIEIFNFKEKKLEYFNTGNNISELNLLVEDMDGKIKIYHPK